jgi:hypothetical protein
MFPIYVSSPYISIRSTRGHGSHVEIWMHYSNYYMKEQLLKLIFLSLDYAISCFSHS